MGAGLFFIGYFLLEIPATLIVERWSARKWIARIMISWGILGQPHGLGPDPDPVLHFALPAGVGRGRLLSRSDRISDALVHPQRSRGARSRCS